MELIVNHDQLYHSGMFDSRVTEPPCICIHTDAKVVGIVPIVKTIIYESICDCFLNFNLSLNNIICVDIWTNIKKRLHGMAFVESLVSGEYCDSGKYGISRQRYTVLPAEKTYKIKLLTILKHNKLVNTSKLLFKYTYTTCLIHSLWSRHQSMLKGAYK
jgi:hypothetical protein